MSEIETRKPEFWARHYGEGKPPWQIDEPCPPVFRYLDEHPEVKAGRIIVPGCGLGHEPRELARRGFEVVGLDLVEAVVERGTALANEAGLTVNYRQGNILEPPADLIGSFDYVFEQTCYCAIDPRDRPLYVQSVTALLKEGGHLMGVFYAADHGNHPPFPISREEVRADFSDNFDILVLEEARHSVERRRGLEWLALFKKRKRAS